MDPATASSTTSWIWIFVIAGGALILGLLMASQARRAQRGRRGQRLDPAAGEATKRLYQEPGSPGQDP